MPTWTLPVAPNPFARKGLWPRTRPFALALALALASVPLARVDHPAVAWSAAVLTVAIALAVVLVPWDRLPRWLTILPSIGIVIVVFLLREGTGGLGDAVDYEALLLLPVLWVALTGSQLELLAVLAVAAGSFAMSIVIAGESGSAWLKAALWPGVAALVGLHTQRLVRHVTRSARSDALTGLPNRARWDDELPREIARSRRTASPLCVGLIDLDWFKSINDRHGHAAGDRVLQNAAAAWSTQLRSTDLLARYGGEEFAILMPETSLDDARDVVERVRARTPDGVTCSAGLAAYRDTDDLTTLMERADEQLYAAKQRGRDRTCVAP